MTPESDQRRRLRQLWLVAGVYMTDGASRIPTTAARAIGIRELHPAGAGNHQERAMARYVISYRAPADYAPGRDDDMAAWAAWFTSIGKDLVDFGSAVRDTAQIGDCGTRQRLRGYSVISAESLDAALHVAGQCPGLQDSGFGVEVAVVQDVPG